MTTIILCNGIHNRSTKSVLSPLGNDFRDLGYEVREYAYPARWALTLYREKIRNKDAVGLREFCKKSKNVILISHSNGSLVSQNAFKMGLEVDQWFSFSGACTSDRMFYPPEAFDHAYSIYNPYDVALKFGAFLPGHKFGRFGSEGYRGNPDGTIDERLTNINGSASGWGLNHSHYFGKERPLWTELVHDNIQHPNSHLGIDRRKVK